MRSVSVRLADLDRVKINLGFAGENEHTHVLFDCKKAFDQYPNATPFLIVTPPRGDIYPAVVTRDGDIVEWVVTDSDLIYHGNGKVQLQFKQGDIIMKSYEAMTSIAKSSEPTGTVPTPIQNWITQANAILASIPDDIAAALAEAKASGQFDGVGIASIAYKSTSGLVDTYTITLTDGSTYDFAVTNGMPGQNGVGIQSIAKTSTVGLVDTYTVTLTNGQTYPFTVTNGQNGVEIDDTTPANNKVFSSAKVAEMNTALLNSIHDVEEDLDNKYEKPQTGIPASDLADGVIPAVDSALSDSSENAVQNKVVKGALDGKAPVIINTTTGNPAVFNDGCGMPIKSLLIQFTPKQTGSDDPSPQNIRPIVPWDGLTVKQGGKSVIQFVTTELRVTINTYNGYSGWCNQLTIEPAFIGKKVTYSVEIDATNSQDQINAVAVWAYRKGGGWQYVGEKGNNIAMGTKGLSTVTVTLWSDIDWIAFGLNVQKGAICRNPMVELGQTASAYEEYHPITETDISFPLPVYGGTLDVVSGVLTVLWKRVLLKGEPSGVSSTYQGSLYYNQNILSDADFEKEFICNRLKYVGYTTTNFAYGTCINNGRSSFNLWVRETVFADKSEAEAWLADNDTEICYQLKTPQEITLTPEQITALVGDNTIWSDANGDIEVEYRADTARFIANQNRNFIAPELSSMKADTALVKNDFRIVGENLYKITSAIASGGTLTPGTNCTKTTLAEVIKSLLT